MDSCRSTPRLTLAASGALALLLALPGLARAAGASFSTVRAQLSATPQHARRAPGRGAGCPGRWHSVPETTTEPHAVPAIAPPTTSLARTLWGPNSDRRSRRRSHETGSGADPSLRGAAHALHSQVESRITQVRRSAAVFHDAHAPPASSIPVVSNQS